MIEKEVIEGTVTNISNKISSKGQAYSIFRVITLDGKEISLFKFENNLKLLNRLCKFEVESNVKNEKEYKTLISLEEVSKK